MTPLAQAALDIARTKIGITEHPPGSNRGPDVDIFIREGGHLNPALGNYAWCACFVSYCVIEGVKVAGGPMEFVPSAGALVLLQLNYRTKIDAPVAGCVGVIDHGNGKGHALFVTSDPGDDGCVDTLEGNSDAAGSRTGGSVVELHRPVSEFAGFFLIQ